MDTSNQESKNISPILPTAAEIERRLPDAATPQDLINEILNRPSAREVANQPEPFKVKAPPIVERVIIPVETPSEVVVPVEAKPTQLSADEEALQNINPHPESSPPSETPPVEEQPEEEGEEGEPKEGVSLQDNYKKLKSEYKTTKLTLKEIEAKKLEAETKLQKYETGEALPQVVKEYEEKLEKADKFVKLYDLTSSREYRQKYIEPVEAIKAEIVEKAKEFNVPEDVIEDIFQMDKKERAEFIDEHFGSVDEDDAYEMRQKLKAMDAIQRDQLEAHKEPARIRQQLQEEFEATDNARRQERAANFTKAAHTSWLKSLSDVRAEGKALELIPREHDETYNNNVVRPILNAASKEYGALVRDLAKNGLEQLPDELAYALANMVQRAHATAISFDTRDYALKKVQELSSSVQSRKYERPTIGGRSGGGQEAPPPAPRGGTPESIQSAAEATLAAGRAAAAQQRQR